MAGHSKWANIKHRKAAQDKKRGKIFTRLIREITISARMGGPDADSNPRLRAAIQTAMAANMTKDTVERAVKRGAGGDEGANLEEIRYEGYGPNGVAVMVDCMTDNRNRTVGEVRHAFTKSNGNLGTDGSVSYLFSKQGVISFDNTVAEDQLMDIAIDAGADDIQVQDDGSADVITTAECYTQVLEALKANDFTPIHAEITMVASTSVDLDVAGAEKILKMIDLIEDLDDVQNVYHNADISADVLAALNT